MKAVIALGLALSLTGTVAQAEPAAVAAAEHWMALIDAGHYAESWSTAGALFQKGVTQDAWTHEASGVRDPMGAVVSRTVRTEQPRTSLPGVPDGSYDIIQFSTEFAHKTGAIETAVLAQDGGNWQVVGYFVK